MSDWTGPSEQLELRELRRAGGPDGSPSRRWHVAAFLIGVLLVALLGFSTDLFDSGPSDLDVSAAYRDGFDQGVVAAEDYWAAQLVERWWDGYKLGQASETSMAPAIISAMREGFSFEAGVQAGMASVDIDIDERYRQGWIDGYAKGWARVTGESSGAGAVPDPPSPGLASRLQWRDGGGEP